MDNLLTRDSLIALVHRAVEPLPFARALWEGGSAAFDRADDFSDVDLSLLIHGSPRDAFAAIEHSLPERDLEYHVPEPAWHGHSQRFYRFRGAPPYLLLDLAIMQGGDLLAQPEIHGHPRVLFDRDNVLAHQPPPPPPNIAARTAALSTRFEMFQILVQKELWRSQPLDALHFYRTLTLAPLTELLRLHHDPTRAHFGGRYLHRILPPPVAAKLQHLSFISSPDDLASKHQEAIAWFRHLTGTQP